MSLINYKFFHICGVLIFACGGYFSYKHLLKNCKKSILFFNFVICFILTVVACSKPLPNPGPFEGYVYDHMSGEPLADATVEASWWCHNSPVPDTGKSYFIRKTSKTDHSGHFYIEKETRRGGLFGSNFSLSVHAPTYIPATLINQSYGPLPDSTKAYPFVATSEFEFDSRHMTISLKPEIDIFLNEIRSPDAFYRKIARQGLEKILGVNHGYDPVKWEKAYEQWKIKKPVDQKETTQNIRTAPCPCEHKVINKTGEKCTKEEAILISGASGWKRLRELKQLVADGANVNAHNANLMTPLMSACSAAINQTQIVQFLLSAGANVNAKNQNCETALMKAAYWGNNEVIILLLNADADINALDENCETAFFKAQLGRKPETVKLLKSRGAIE